MLATYSRRSLCLVYFYWARVYLLHTLTWWLSICQIRCEDEPSSFAVSAKLFMVAIATWYNLSIWLPVRYTVSLFYQRPTLIVSIQLILLARLAFHLVNLLDDALIIHR